MHGLLAGLLLGITLSLVAGAIVAWLAARRRHGVEIQPQSRLPVAVSDALQQVTVASIMIPRTEIQGINLDTSPDDLLSQLQNATHTRLPLYREDINQIEGILHLRQLPRLLTQGPTSAEQLL